jgi:cytoskeleton protein RodZ
VRLFQRIRTPFADVADAEPSPAYSRPYGIGDLLRDRREELGLDLNQVGETLRIKPIYLAALEQGRAQDLPGPTYAIGFIRAYAHYLGFDSERILERYKAETAEVHARPDLSLPVPLGSRSLPGGPILLVGLILALCGYGTWYYLSTGDRSRPERVAPVPAELSAKPGATAAAGSRTVAERPGLSTGLGAPPDAAAAPAGEAAARAAGPGSTSPAATSRDAASPRLVAGPASTPLAAAADSGAVASLAPAPPGAGGTTGEAGQIDIRALADCWIQVRSADQEIVFSKVLKAGETYRVPRAGLFLRTGNAGALAVAVDGKPAPALGGIGTLRRNVALDPQALLAGTAVHG